MHPENQKDSTIKWFTQYVIVPIVVAFIAGGAGTAVIISIRNDQAITPTPLANVTAVALVNTPTILNLPTETFTPSPIPTATATSLPTNTPISPTDASIPIANFTSIPSPTSPPQPPTNLREALNRIFGDGNWFCMSNRSDAVGIRKIPSKIVIQYPLSSIEKDGVIYHSDQPAPSGGSGTAWLQTTIASVDCPNMISTQIQKAPTRQIMDTVLGQGNWACFSDIRNAVKIKDVPSTFTVKYPFNVIDKEGVRYAENESVPSGGPATGWLC